jgi:probable F420-dependent oxidoreductase
VKIGIVPVNVGVADPSWVGEVAALAESSGLESVWTFEHVMVPVDYASRYPYSSKGKMGAAPETPFLDPLITLSWVAARTTSIRLGTGINILPIANPLLLAKQAATLDVLSGGRLELGLGIGWLAEEFDAMGTPFARRGARFDDYIAAMKKVWSGEVVEHDGEFVSWSGFKSHPLPAQRPHMPLVIGGTSARAMRRVAEHGDGWIAPNKGADQLAEQLVALHAALAERGRAPESVEVTAMWTYSKEPDALSRYADMGVSRLLVPLTALGGPLPAALAKLGELSAP